MQTNWVAQKYFNLIFCQGHVKYKKNSCIFQHIFNPGLRFKNIIMSKGYRTTYFFLPVKRCSSVRWVHTCHNTRGNFFGKAGTMGPRSFVYVAVDAAELDPPWHLARQGPFWAIAKRLLGSISAEPYSKRASAGALGKSESSLVERWALWSSVCEEAKGNWKLLAYLFLWYAARAASCELRIIALIPVLNWWGL